MDIYQIISIQNTQKIQDAERSTHFSLPAGEIPPCRPDLKLGRSLSIIQIFVYFILKLFGIYPFMQSSAATVAAAEAKRMVPSGPH